MLRHSEITIPLCALRCQGFLMRRAFELAFATAYVFCGKRPKFIEASSNIVLLLFHVSHL